MCMYIYIYIYVYTHTCIIDIYIYICIHRCIICVYTGAWTGRSWRPRRRPAGSDRRPVSGAEGHQSLLQHVTHHKIEPYIN